MDRADAPGAVVLSGEHLSKRFGSVVAVDDVSLQIRSGEILAIVGDNGAGKSTVVKMLAGALEPDGGAIYVDGRRVHFRDVHDARQCGIETVYQDLALTPNLDVAANFFLGRELVLGGIVGAMGFLNRRKMRQVAQQALDQLQIQIPKVTGTPVARLSGGQRQSVAVARAMFWASRVLMMDEPTAALGVAEAQAVLGLVKRAATQHGMSIVMVSHVLPHVIALADRVLVMRHGRKVAEMERDEVSQERLISLIVGFEQAGR